VSCAVRKTLFDELHASKARIQKYELRCVGLDAAAIDGAADETLSPSQEDTLFSDHLITIAGRSITITSHDMLMMVVSVVTGLLFWTTLYFSRKRIVVLKRSSGTDQVAFELSRIAEALERIANRPADDAIAAASRRQQQIQPPPQRESKGIAYSMLGR
jgi:hypothetical protein